MKIAGSATNYTETDGFTIEPVNPPINYCMSVNDIIKKIMLQLKIM